MVRSAPVIVMLYSMACYNGLCYNDTPDSKVHGVNMGPIWGQQDPGGPHVGPMNIAIWDLTVKKYREKLPLFFIILKHTSKTQ